MIILLLLCSLERIMILSFVILGLITLILGIIFYSQSKSLVGPNLPVCITIHRGQVGDL